MLTGKLHQMLNPRNVEADAASGGDDTSFGGDDTDLGSFFGLSYGGEGLVNVRRS